MRRRDFITGIAGAAAWPLSARAQQGERIRRIGVLLFAAADDPEYQTRIGAFLQVLGQLGWSIGRNVAVDTRWPTAATDIRRHAAELVALAPDVILATGGGAPQPVAPATRRLPVPLFSFPPPRR